MDHEICLASSRTSPCGMGALEHASFAFAVPGLGCSAACKDSTRTESPSWQGRFLTWNSCDHQECRVKISIFKELPAFI